MLKMLKTFHFWVWKAVKTVVFNIHIVERVEKCS